MTNQTIVPRAMTVMDIRNTVHAFAAAAARAEKAGFDVVEIHAAHGYLISQFLTPFENRRTDQYGGELENRARMGLEVLRACKAAVKIPVIYRLSVDDYFPEGLQYAEGKQVALWAAKAGADALHIAAGHYRSLPSAARMIPPMAEPDATFLAYAAAVKKEVSIPVIAVGRLNDPDQAAEAVEMGKADFIALGRTSIAEPEWVEKLKRGEPPRRCLACNSCVNEMRGGSQLRCVVNGRAGRETEFVAGKPPSGERIAVIGAGPAGLTYASLVADGNTVTVFEREAVPGGAFRYAGKAPLFQEVDCAGKLVRSLHREPGQRLRAQGRDVPLQHRRRKVARPAGPVRPHRDRKRRQVPPWSRTAGDADARFGRRALAGLYENIFERSRARLVLSPRPQGDRRHPQGAGEAGAESHGDRRCAHGGQEPAGDRQRIRGGAAGRRT